MTTRRRGRVLLCIALALVGGGSCSNPAGVEAPAQLPIIQSFLTPGESATVKLRWTLPPGRYYAGLEDTVGGAVVEISTGADHFMLSEDEDEPGTYRISREVMPVIPGHTYRLRVHCGDRHVRAVTEVPLLGRIRQFTADTVVYYPAYGDLYGELAHPGEWRWDRSDNAAGYIIRIEAVDVHSLGDWALPLTADLDTLLARRQRLEGRVGADSLASLERQITELRAFFTENVSLVVGEGDTLAWLRQRDQQDWDDIDLESEWSEGKKWRERMDELFWARQVNYWVPVDTVRADYWWLGLRFAGEYQVTVQAVDRNYLDYFATAGHGHSGADGDQGPLFHVEGGLGVFGSYAQDSFRIQALRGAGDLALRIHAKSGP